MAYTLKGSGWNLMGAAHYAIRLVVVVVVVVATKQILAGKWVGPESSLH